jgi:hypothetical protein
MNKQKQTIVKLQQLLHKLTKELPPLQGIGILIFPGLLPLLQKRGMYNLNAIPCVVSKTNHSKVTTLRQQIKNIA